MKSLASPQGHVDALCGCTLQRKTLILQITLSSFACERVSFFKLGDTSYVFLCKTGFLKIAYHLSIRQFLHSTLFAASKKGKQDSLQVKSRRIVGGKYTNIAV